MQRAKNRICAKSRTASPNTRPQPIRATTSCVRRELRLPEVISASSLVIRVGFGIAHPRLNGLPALLAIAWHAKA